jgi:hypothetical protein
MKPAYLGGVRGYQSAVYRPGLGWSGADSHRHAGHQPAVFKRNQSLHVCPLTVAHRRRPGLKTKTAIIAIVAAVAGLLTLVLSGAAQL